MLITRVRSMRRICIIDTVFTQCCISADAQCNQNIINATRIEECKEERKKMRINKCAHTILQVFNAPHEPGALLALYSDKRADDCGGCHREAAPGSEAPHTPGRESGGCGLQPQGVRRAPGRVPQVRILWGGRVSESSCWEAYRVVGYWGVRRDEGAVNSCRKLILLTLWST